MTIAKAIAQRFEDADPVVLAIFSPAVIIPVVFLALFGLVAIVSSFCGGC